MQRTTASNAPLTNLYLLIILSLTYTAAHYWPVLRYAMLFIIIGFGLPMLLSRRFFETRIFWWWLAYIFVVAINVVFGDKYFDSGMSLLYEAAYLFIPASMMYYAFSSDDIIFQKRSLVLFVIITVLMTIATIFFSGLYSGAMRNVYRYSEQENEGFYASLYRWGFAKYSLAHSLCGVMPVVLLGLKNRKLSRINRFLLWMALLSLLLLSYYSGSFACLMLTFGGLIISLVVKEGKVLNNLGRLLVFAIVLGLTITPSIRISILDNLGSMVDSDNDFYKKIIEFQEMEKAENVLDVQGDVSVRLNLYSKSLKAGVSNLLIGTDGELLGNHSTFLDRFGSLGLVGIIPYLFFIVVTVSYSMKFIQANIKVYYWTSLIINFLMFVSKSTNSWDFWFVTLFVLPVAIKVLTPKEEKN